MGVAWSSTRPLAARGEGRQPREIATKRDWAYISAVAYFADMERVRMLMVRRSGVELTIATFNQ